MQAISFVLNMKFLQIQKMKQTLPQRIVVLNSSISISIFNFIFIFSSVKFRFVDLFIIIFYHTDFKKAIHFL